METVETVTTPEKSVPDVEITDDLLDLFLFYVDDVCEEKIKELTLQVRFYGLVVCTITVACVIGGVLFLTVSILCFLNNDDDTMDSFEEGKISNGEERYSPSNARQDVSPNSKRNHSSNLNLYRSSTEWLQPIFGLEHSFSSDIEDKDAVNKETRKLTPPSTAARKRAYNHRDVYTSQWDLTKKVKDKALFWRKSRSELGDYPGYESLLDLYTNPTSISVSQGRPENIQQEETNNEVLEDDYSENLCTLKRTTNISSSQFMKARSYSSENISAGIMDCADYTSTRAYSRSSIQKTPQSKSGIYASLEDDTDFQNISLLMEDDEENNNENALEKVTKSTEDYSDIDIDIDKEGLLIKPRECQLRANSKRRTSRSEDNILNSSVKERNMYDSKIHVINMSKIGPTYLHIYLNNVYCGWDDFEKRTKLEIPDSSDTINIKTINRALKCITRRNMNDYKKNKTIDQLRIIRFGFICEKYHELILNDVIKNSGFLGEVIMSEKVDDEIKLEIYQIFYYSFCYESIIQLSFEFVNEVVRCLIISVSSIKNKPGSTLYGDGIRCLHGILCYSNLDDFIGDIFDVCFRDINENGFEVQNTKWELLKLVICEWMSESETLHEIADIFIKLRVKVNRLITEYVEKDNEKFHEFLLIWKMLREYADGADKENVNTGGCDGERKYVDSNAKTVATACTTQISNSGQRKSCNDRVKRRFSRKNEIRRSNGEGIAS